MAVLCARSLIAWTTPNWKHGRVVAAPPASTIPALSPLSPACSVGYHGNRIRGECAPDQIGCRVARRLRCRGVCFARTVEGFFMDFGPHENKDERVRPKLIDWVEVIYVPSDTK